MKAASVARWSGRHILMLLLFIIVLIVVASVSVWLLNRQPQGASLQAVFSVKFWLLGTLWRFALYTAIIYIGFILIGARRKNDAQGEINQIERALDREKHKPSSMSGQSQLIADLEHNLQVAYDQVERVDHAKNILFKSPMRVWTPVLALEGLFQLFYIVLLR